MDIHIARNGKQSGPFSLEEVKRQLATGALLPTDLAWTQGAVDWVPLESFPGIALPQAQRSPPPMSPLRNLNPGQPGPGLATPQAPQQAQTSGAAIASLIFGILSFSCLPLIATIFAIIFGHTALSGIRKSGGALKGEAIAIIGLVLGYLSILFLPIFAAVVLPVFGEIQVRGMETKMLSDAKVIATACRLYALDHHDVFPPKLEDLVPQYLQDPNILATNSMPGGAPAFQYFGGTVKDAPDKVLLMSNFKDRRGKRIIMHVDGSGAVQVPPPALQP